MGQTPHRRYLREEGLTLVHGGKVQSIMTRSRYMTVGVVCQLWRQDLGAAHSHLGTSGRNAGTWFVFFLSTGVLR